MNGEGGALVLKIRVECAVGDERASILSGCAHARRIFDVALNAILRPLLKPMQAGDVRKRAIQHRVGAGDATSRDERQRAVHFLSEFSQQMTQRITRDDLVGVGGEIYERAVEIKKQCVLGYIKWWWRDKCMRLNVQHESSWFGPLCADTWSTLPCTARRWATRVRAKSSARREVLSNQA